MTSKGTISSPTPKLAQLRLGLSISLSLIFLGWALTAYQASLWGWLGTIVSLQHLAKNGRGAIPLAIAWSTGFIWVAAFYYSTPVGFLWRNAKYWALSLIFLWIFATGLILSVSKIPTTFKTMGSPQETWLISSLFMTGCLGLGIYSYHLGLELL